MTATLSPQFFGAVLLLFIFHPFAIKSIPIKFESFENVQKGEVGHEIKQVKQYLRSYGYYHHEVVPLDDRFDDALKSALKAYQDFYSLDVTGKIDPDTIKAMLTPRCGVPDINLEKTSNYVLNNGRNKWSTYDLTYNYLSNSTQVPNLRFLQFKNAIGKAFGTWESATKFRFSEVLGATGDIGIGFYQGDHGDGYPFDGVPSNGNNVLAHASYPGSRFMFLHFDGAEKWSTNPTSADDVDAESIALHEIGHNLGLNHSLDKNAVMYAMYLGGTKRALDKDDIAGIADLYQ